MLAALYVLAWYAFLYLKSFRKANPPKLPEEKKPLVTAYNESYASFESRLQSFDNCNVELLNQYVGNLCEAGFYYTGKLITHLPNTTNNKDIFIYLYFF